MVIEVLDYYREREVDPGYQGQFEKLYTDAFVEMMGGGYADAVATGTSALYVAVAALDLPKGSEVIVSPITDPGIACGDRAQWTQAAARRQQARTATTSAPSSSPQRITPERTGAIIVHAAGQAAEIDKIVEIAHAHGIKVHRGLRAVARRECYGRSRSALSATSPHSRPCTARRT